MRNVCANPYGTGTICVAIVGASLPSLQENQIDQRVQSLSSRKDVHLNCTECCAYDASKQAKYKRDHPEAFAESQRKHNGTEKRRQSQAKYKQSEKHALNQAKYAPRKKELHARDYERIHSDVGLNLEHGIGVKIGQMIKGSRIESMTIMQYSEFADAEDIKVHLQSTFDVGMTLDNFGKHIRGGPRVWNVGHRIARFHYDANCLEDVKRCWSKANLFAQWADENIKLKVQFPHEEALLKLRAYWPTAWNGQLPSPEERTCMERAVFANCGKWAQR